MKGILFKPTLIQANVAGRKTQTRRLAIAKTKNSLLSGDWTDEYIMHEGNREWLLEDSRYKTGDLVYIKEKYRYCQPYGPESLRYQYADGSYSDVEVEDDYKIIDYDKWRSPLHMPEAAARYFIRIKQEGIERIASITAADAQAEGIEPYRLQLEPGTTLWRNYSDNTEYYYSPIASFRSLWQMVHGIPAPVQERINGSLVTTGYIVYPWGDEESLQPFAGVTTWKGKPLTVVPNPLVFAYEYDFFKSKIAAI